MPGAVGTQWSAGQTELIEGVIGGTSGRVTFSRLTLDGGAAPGSPLELSGEIRWSCGEWVR